MSKVTKSGARAGKTGVTLVCPICTEKFLKNRYEAKRNHRLNRVNLCSRTCHATFMNYSPAKQAQTKAMLKERNAHQFGEDNANWRGGTSASVWGKPLKEPPHATDTIRPGSDQSRVEPVG